MSSLTHPEKATVQSFQGVWTAIVTPFKTDEQIDWDAYDKLLKLQEAAGVTGVVVSGTTGECPTLTVQEKLSLIRRARATLSPKVRVMAGTGDNNTAQSVELSRLAQDAGADSLLVVTPPYNKPSTAGLVNHFKLISQAVGLPICLYHVPGRTAQLLSVDQIDQITKVDKVVAVKEASADIALFSRALIKSGKAFLSGDDPTYLGSLAVGGCGVISVVSNVFPAEMVALTNAYFNKDTQKARALHDTLLAFIDVLFCEVNPCPTKAVLEMMGLVKNVVRAPLAPVTPASYQKIKEIFATTKEQLAKIR